MVLNLVQIVSFLAFQQVLNTCLFVTKTDPFKLFSVVIYTFENDMIYKSLTL